MQLHVGAVNQISQGRRSGWKERQHQRTVITTIEGFARPSAGATIATHDVTIADRMGLNVIVSHESSCKYNGLRSNTTSAIVLVLATTTQAVANGVRHNCLTALLACHHAVATQVVTMSDAAPGATANAVGIGRNEALGTRNKIGSSCRQRHYMRTGTSRTRRRKHLTTQLQCHSITGRTCNSNPQQLNAACSGTHIAAAQYRQSRGGDMRELRAAMQHESSGRRANPKSCN